MDENQKDLLLKAAAKMRESADMIDAACGECQHPRAAVAGQRLMGQRIVTVKCPDCGEKWTAPVEEMRPGPAETFTALPKSQPLDEERPWEMKTGGN
jgi:endogenous inhibitor of DNA gyrase (YacG/DUF329 family)